jgi:ubiquinone/menaquinone biosynthesis C-methylase UbiE
MNHSAASWHQRFTLQASWTAEMRKHLILEKAGINPGPILEAGCGTGAVLSDLQKFWKGPVYGIDLREDFLIEAKQQINNFRGAAGDASRLPFPDRTFSAVISHYFLMWLSKPEESLIEIQRVIQPGGLFFLFAEPDYGGRIDFPSNLNAVKKLQIEGLKKAGADPEMGRKLPGLLHKSGFRNVVSGVYENRFPTSYPEDWIISEQMILKGDLQRVVSESELQKILSRDAEAWKTGNRLIHVPTFYAWGTAP